MACTVATSARSGLSWVIFRPIQPVFVSRLMSDVPRKRPDSSAGARILRDELTGDKSAAIKPMLAEQAARRAAGERPARPGGQPPPSLRRSDYGCTPNESASWTLSHGTRRTDKSDVRSAPCGMSASLRKRPSWRNAVRWRDVANSGHWAFLKNSPSRSQRFCQPLTELQRCRHMLSPVH